MTFDPEQTERDYIASLESFDPADLDRRCDAVRERIEVRSEPLYARLRDLRFRSQLPPPGPRLNPIGASDHAPQEQASRRDDHESVSRSPDDPSPTWRVRIEASLTRSDHASPDAQVPPACRDFESPPHVSEQRRMTPDSTPDLLADHVLGSYFDPLQREQELAESVVVLEPAGPAVRVIVVTENDSSGIVR